MNDPVTRADALWQKGRRADAFRVLLRAARRGDASTFHNLGYFYDVGLGVRRSKRRALYWYRRAVARGEGSAAHNIATIYRDRNDCLRAARWLHEAIRLGESGSNLLLGQLVLARLGQPAEALACFRAVRDDATAADLEGARVWAGTAEGMIACSGR